jgi:predicted Zn finger-like uncharacterized protein
MNVSCPDCRSIFRVDPSKVPPNGVRARCSVCSGVISIPAPSGQSTPASSPAWTPNASAESAETRSPPTPSTQPGWDTKPFSAPAARTPAAPATQRPTPPAPPTRSVETPAAQRARPESTERTAAAATATPPSAAAGVPGFRPSPLAPPFKPAGAPATAPSSPPASAQSAGPFVPGATRAPTAIATPIPAANPVPPLRSAPTPPSAVSSSGADAGARRPLNPFLSKDPNQRAKRLARALVSDIITYHPAKHSEGLRDGTLKQLFREEIKKSFEEYIAQVGQQLAESTTYFQEALNEVLGAGKKIF